MLKGVGLRDMFCKKVVVVNFPQAVLRMASKVTYNDTAPLKEVAFFFLYTANIRAAMEYQALLQLCLSPD